MKQIIILFFSLTLINICYSCRVLVLSGGGAHGAFQAGVIKKLHDEGIKWEGLLVDSYIYKII